MTNTKEIVKYDGMLDCVRKIYKNEGFRAFYKGLTPNLLKTFPSSGVFFLAYEFTLKVLDKLNDWWTKQFCINISLIEDNPKR